jgi:hypothetical protein
MFKKELVSFHPFLKGIYMIGLLGNCVECPKYHGNPEYQCNNMGVFKEVEICAKEIDENTGIESFYDIFHNEIKSCLIIS